MTPLVISASRRTDIPNHYVSWFLQRLREGYVLVRNIRDYHQVRKIDLTAKAVACIVFWTKNPAPLMEHLAAISSYPYYVHFSITPYGSDIEPKIPPLGESIDCFKRLADAIGKERVIWRYDPVFVSKKYPIEYHLASFNYIAHNLKGHTLRCVFSFLDIYHHLVKQMEILEVLPVDEKSRHTLVHNFALQTQENQMEIQTCAEGYDFSAYGVTHTSCIDADIIERLSGFAIEKGRDQGQRKNCRCAPSVDIGMYNTCLNLCTYCYANHSERKVHTNYAQARSNSPLLIGTLGKNDVVLPAKVTTKAAQLSLFGEL